MDFGKPDDGDRRTNEVWSTGRAMSYGYDDAHQLTSVAASRPSDAARYRYDAAGNPVDRAELGLDVTNSFNNLNQIVTGSWTGSTVTVAGSVNYPLGSISVNNTPGTIYPDSSFDVANVPVAPGTNTLVATYTGPAYTNAPMTATDTSTVVLGDTAYTHDANGNLTSDATFTYQYDTANQLTNVIRKADNTTVLQCRYDALGRRVEAIRSDGTVDRYIYFPGTFLVLAVLDGSNTPQEFYTRGPDLSGTLSSAGGIGGILACTYASSPAAPVYHHSDLMGNVIAISDFSTVFIATFHYTPAGQLSSLAGEVTSRFLFSSKEWNAETGLLYYGIRYQSVRLGRWLSRDPFWNIESALLFNKLAGMNSNNGRMDASEGNVYMFLKNDSMFFVDPDGQRPKAKGGFSDVLVPGPKDVATCWAKCMGKRLLGGVFDKYFDRASLCGRIRNHCLDNLKMPNLADVVEDRTLEPNVHGFQEALACLGKCLDITGTIDLKATISSANEGHICCNKDEKSVDYQFKVVVQWILYPPEIVLSESTEDYVGSCTTFTGVWAPCCFSE